jgi:hypothetical protein
MVSEEERKSLFERETQKILEARKDIKKIIEPHKESIRDQIMELKGTLGVGIGEKEILVLVDETEKVPVIPTEIEGVPIKIELTSKFTIFPDFRPTLEENTGRKEKWRPIPGGVAGGHKRLGGYGTLGGMVYMGGEKYVLSNNHVLARSNYANVGDAVSQPWREHTFGILKKFIPVANGVKVDCALAKPYTDTDVTEVLLKGDTDYEPYVYTTGVKKPHSGERVVKSGARTGFVSGRIKAVHVAATVNYRRFSITLQDQIYTTLIGWPGDSGSLVLDEGTNEAVGLLFAGGTKGNLHNDITNVMDALGCDMSVGIGVIPKIGKLDIMGVPDKAEIWLREEKTE